MVLNDCCTVFRFRPQLWTGQPHRSTRDLDLLGYGAPSPERLQTIFIEICSLAVDADGVVFSPETIQAEQINEDAEYLGIRLRIECRLENARLTLQIDIGFGDAITPEPLSTNYPTLLEFPAPQLRAYPRETVVAEKFQAMVAMGIANSRMKDFYDVWTLCRQRLRFRNIRPGHIHGQHGNGDGCRRRDLIIVSPP